MGPFEEWQPLAGLVVGVAAGVQAVLFRAGVNRRGTAWYWDESEPFHRRNMAFTLLPISVMFCSAMVGGSVISSDEPKVEALGWTLTAVATAGAMAGVLFAYRPPTFLKPHWLRAEELTRGTPKTPPGARRVVERLVVGASLLALALCLAGAVWGAVVTAT